ncbi:fatty acyl-CoA reductase wat [Helicoverpa armigera]|uniref:fatty acyl-CoA reductase wat n=1 Tax=Helicoverpa armigera TaxID=29058 RepID=UPI003083160E
MDHAREIELKLLEQLKPINELTDRGNSAVQQFYCGATVFVTGGSGFLGKHLIEKLFRSCEIKKIYLLLRPKRGKTIQERMTYIFKDPLYDTIRSKKPDFVDRIVPVEGDVAELGLGIDEKVYSEMADEVNVIFHMAATVNFDEPLQNAGIINVRGTREVIELGKRCKNLKLLNHVSTAFAHATASRIETDVEEKFYPSPVAPDIFLNMIESMDVDRINDITPALVKDWPNTYTFTKAIAEELVRSYGGELPVCVVKPPVVCSSYLEPSPGWIDNQTVMSNPVGFLLGIGLGVIHVMLVDRERNLSYAPIDYVNNAIIAAGWDSVQNRQMWRGDVPIYTVSTSQYGFSWKQMGDIIRTDEFHRISTPRLLWYAYLLETNNRLLYWILTWLLHYLPGYFLDTIVDLLGVRPKGAPELVKVYSRAYKLTKVYRYFLSNEWNFRDDNLMAMVKRMSPEDKIIYNCNMETVKLKEFMQAMCLGLRRFIIKDGLKNTALGYRKQKMFYYANIIFIGLYMYLIWKVLYYVYSTVAMMMPL